jgi:L-amino acid N-acyltransferase YncA
MLPRKWFFGNIGIDTLPSQPETHPMNRCRLAQLTDAPAIQAIYAPVVRDTVISFEYEPPGVEEIERRMRKVLGSRPWLVYEAEEQVLGYAYASTFRERAAYDWGPEVSIYVKEGAQGRGIGRELYATLFNVLRALNYCQVWAGATIPNESSERLHRAMGFELVGRFPSAGYKFGKWHDTVFWRLALRDFPAEAPVIGNINELIRNPEWAWLIRG